MFITFEGIEGCGKSTQLALAAESLRRQGHTVVTTREPGGTPIGEQIRSVLLDTAHGAMTPTTELLLYNASRSQHVDEVIRPAIARGSMVLCDRYADATVAYQGAARRIDLQVLAQLHTIATGNLQPTLTLIFDLPVGVGQRRMTSRGATPDRLEQEARGFHERVRQGYLALAKHEATRCRVVDASQTIDEVHAAVMKYMTERIYVE